MNIRQANKSEAKALLKFLKELITEKCKTITTIEALPSLEQEVDWLNSKDGERGIVYIALSENKIIGMLKGLRLSSMTLDFNAGKFVSADVNGFVTSEDGFNWKK